LKIYEVTWKNIVELDRPQITIWHMHHTSWKSKAIDTHFEYVILIAFSAATMVARNYLSVTVYRVSQEACARLQEGVPYVKVYQYNPKHVCPKLNGYGDKGVRKVWSSCGSTYCTWFA